MKRWEVKLNVVVEAHEDEGHINVGSDVIDAVASLPGVVSVDQNGSPEEL